ncbi:GH3 auxin-responsive promoter family protein [bacterium]|nr:GH3 auxin-responsive promoter family protein [bacterium]
MTNIKEAVIIQKNILKHIIEEIKYTEFAKSYHLDVGMDDIYKEYIGKVPIVNYEEFQKWIEKAKKNPDVLWP